MRVPVTIPVAGKAVKLNYKETVPGGNETDPDVYGDTSSDGKEIRISTTMNKSEREVFETAFHECLHSALAVSGVAHMFKDDLEELLVTNLESALAHLFCFNPDAPGVKWKDVPFPFEE